MLNYAEPVDFLYDALGRIEAAYPVPGTETDYQFDDRTEIGTTTAGGTTVDSVLTMPGSGEVLSYSYPNGGSTTTFVPIQDQVGSTVALVDASGNLAEQFSYEPYGKVTASGQATGYPYLFAGMEQADALSGLYRTFARYYNPHLQRFLSEDPLGFTAGDANFFGYAADNPVSGSDPLGECALGDCAGGDNGSAGSGGDSNGGGFFLELFESFYSQLADLFGGGGSGHPYIRGQGFKAHTINRNTGIPSDEATTQHRVYLVGMPEYRKPPGPEIRNAKPEVSAPIFACNPYDLTISGAGCVGLGISCIASLPGEPEDAPINVPACAISGTSCIALGASL